MDETLREQMALFRYAVIGELVSRELAPGEKSRLLEAIATKEWEIPGSSRRHVGISTAQTWVDLYQAMGFAGLKPRARSDKGASRALPEPVQDLLLRLRRERPKASLISLIRAARVSGAVPAELRLAPTTVYRLFAAHGLDPAPAPSALPDAKAFTHPHANDLWTSDVMHGPRLLEPGHGRGTRTYLHAFLDDTSRLVPFAAFYKAETSACFHDALKQALQRRGLPQRLYCDNGALYRSQHLHVICATLGISLIHSRPYQPRGRGKIERFFRHVRSSFLPHLSSGHLGELAKLNRVFWAWLEGEYHQTPHRGLDGRAPLERFADDAARLRSVPEDLVRLMRLKLSRVVARDRTVRLDGRLFEAPDGFAGETVDILYDPYDPQQPVYLRRRGESEEHRLRPLDLELNARLRRAPRQSEPAPEPEPTPTGISYLDLLAKKQENEP